MKQKKPNKSILAKKITFKFLLIESALFLLVITVFWNALLPALIDSTIKKCDYIATTIVNLFDNQIQNMSNYAYMVSNSKDIAFILNQNTASNNSKSSQQAQTNILLNDIASNNSFCRRIILEGNDHSIYSSITNKYENDLDIFNSEEYKEIQNGTKSSWISNIYAYKNNKGSLAYSIAYCKKTYYAGNPHIISIYSDVTDIFSYMNNTTSTFFDDLALYDIYGNMLFHSENTDIFSEKEKVPDIYHYDDYSILKSGDHFTSVYGNNNLCAIVGYTSKNTLYRDFLSYFVTIILSFTLIFVATVIILLPMITRSLAPLNNLYTAMKEIMRGKTGARSSVVSKDEIGDLSYIYNSMLDTIDNTTKMLVEKEHEKNRLRFSLIVSQIDPHFIFNTMNIITSLARKNKCDDIIEINTALIKLLQDRLRISETEILDSISHEISITKEYIKITQYRTQMNVKFDWIYTDDILLLQMPKNILQPIIENSIIHGFYDVYTGNIEGEIKIEFLKNGNAIIITVTDNGNGISKEALEAFNSDKPSGNSETRGQYIGLRNIRDRLMYIYPNIENVMVVKNISPHGVSVTLTIQIND